MMDLYFDGKDHEKNFYELVELYNYKDGINLSSTYIAAHPAIFKCLRGNKKLGDLFNPITLLQDVNGGYSNPILTEESKQLCLFSASIFNGHPVDLSKVLCKLSSLHLFYVLLQSLVLASPDKAELFSEQFFPDVSIFD